TGGVVMTAICIDSSVALALVLQRDGKLVAAGLSYYNNANDGVFALVRYNADGTLDPTFGTGGTVATDFGTPDDEASALVLQPDGKLVDDGDDAAGFALVRHNPDGSLDPTFGTGGVVTTAIIQATNSSVSNGLVLQPDGKLVAAGGTRIVQLLG